MDPLGECPAVEVFKFRDKDGYFGQVLTSISSYFGQVIAPRNKDSTHIPDNWQWVAYHWSVMKFNGKRESLKRLCVVICFSKLSFCCIKKQRE